MTSLKNTQNDKCKSESVSYFDLLTNNAPQAYDDYNEEADILNKQIEDFNVHNIAIVARYGAGKSCVIKTYLDKYRNEKVNRFSRDSKSGKNNYAQISLSTFNESDYDETAIERSILQQLLYSKRKQSLPNSEIRRTKKTSLINTFITAVVFTLFLASVVLFGIEIKNNLFGVNWIKYVFLGIATLALFGILFGAIYFHKLKRIKYKDFETEFHSELSKNETKQVSSLINKFIDEILYFFECVNLDLVIFEDLDRLPNKDIFVKLRELNTIINGSEKSKKKVTFLYAVKDDLFHTEEERAKFFDFILPIVPVINPVTTQKTIEDKLVPLKNYNSKMDLTGKFVKCISSYIPDMRVLNNTFNDYVLMFHKIIEDINASDKLKSENLFALCLYKNLFPYDYALLENNKGLIPLIVDINKLKKKCQQNLIQKIDNVKKAIEAVNEEKLNSFEELKAMFIGQIYQMPVDNSYYHNNIDPQNITTFDGLKFTSLMHPRYNDYYRRVKLDSGDDEILTPAGEHYLDKENAIKIKAEKDLAAYKNKLVLLEKEKQEISTWSFATIIGKYGVDFCFNEVYEKEYKNIISNDKVNISSQFSYLRMLIAQKYIDEHYIEYTSNYKSEVLSPNDTKIIQSIQGGFCDFDMHIEDMYNVCRQLNDEDFARNSVLSKDILNCINELYNFSKNENDNKYNNLLNLLSSKDNEYVISIINKFISISDKKACEDLLEHLIPKRPTICEELIKVNLLEQERIDLLIVNSIKHINNYSNLNEEGVFIDNLSKHRDYLTLFADVKDDEKVLRFLNSFDIKFKTVSCVEINGRIQQFIIHNNKYEISYQNLKTIFEIEDDRDALSRFNSANYDYIMNSNQDSIKNYIQFNINDYLSNVLLTDSIDCQREPQTGMFDLLTRDDVSLENKEALVKKSRIVYDDISEFDEMLFSTLLNNNRIEAKWSNILIAFEHCGFDCVKNFLTANKQIDGPFEIFDSIKPETPESFVGALLTKLELNEIRDIIKTLPATFPLDTVIKYAVSDSALTLLICEGKVDYCNTDLQNLFTKLDVLNAYIACHHEQVTVEFDKFFAIALPILSRRLNPHGYYEEIKSGQANSQTIIANVIQCDNIDLSIKQTLIEKCVDIINISGYERKFADYILKYNQIVPYKVLWQFINDVDNISIDEKKQILLIHLNNEDIISEEEMLKKYFSSLGDNWNDLFTNNELNIEKTDINAKLIHKMKMLKIVTFSNRKNTIAVKIA